MSRCPACNSENCYIPLINKPECINKECVYFSQKQFDEANTSINSNKKESISSSASQHPSFQLSFLYDQDDGDVDHNSDYFVPGSIYFSDRED
jgi:hypothetical protein